jgi:hypothetical protein
LATGRFPMCAAMVHFAAADAMPSFAARRGPARVQRKVTRPQLHGMQAIEPKLRAFYPKLDDK